MNRELRIRSHAKLNLALRVGSAGQDGFHPLATVFQTVAFGDILYARRLDPAADQAVKQVANQAAGQLHQVATQAANRLDRVDSQAADEGGGGSESPLQLQVDGPELPQENTVTRAVNLLAEEVRAHGIEPAPIAMRLVKRVPQGAGLGGGSSDAVAALAACMRLWHLRKDLLDWSGALQRIAAEVGSDVPFFLVGGTALGTGRGTRIEPLEPLPATWLVIAMPDVQVSTVDAYAAFDRCRDDAGALSAAVPLVPAYDASLATDWMGNDLAAPVVALEPRIEAVRGRLKELGAGIAQMTGSGAATFGSFASRRAAARAAATLRRDGTWAVATVSITGSQHRRALYGEDTD